MSLFAVGLAGFGGLLWGFGVLGKRLGVQGAEDKEKGVRATCTIFLYSLVSIIPSVIDALTSDRQLLMETFADSRWSHRVPGIFCCGIISGCGGLLGTLALAWSAGSSSALISVLENGMYTVAGAALIAVYFQEHPMPLQYFAAVLILSGIVCAQTGGGSPAAEEDAAAEAAAAEDEMVLGPAAAEEEDERRRGSITPAASASSSEAAGQLPKVEEAPAVSRNLAVALAVVAGLCWGFGPFGKKYGVSGAPDGSAHSWTTCTYVVYMSATVVFPVLRLLLGFTREQRRAALGNPAFRRLLLGACCCALVAGLGGLMSTLAFARSKDEGALISVIENGVYTVSGALMIATCFGEWPKRQHLLSAALVVSGLCLSATAA